MIFAHATTFWTLALWLSSTGCSGQIEDNIYNITKEERLIFGNLTTTFTTATGHVRHMEVDQLRRGYIIFSDWKALKTTNGTTTITLADSDNSPRYRNGLRLKDFTHIQRPGAQVFIADRINHCLLRLDRKTGLITHLAGNCTFPGYADGNATFAKFNSPVHMLSDPQNSSIIIITDENNNAIRSLNLDTMVVSTIASSSELDFPLFTLWENNNHMSLLVSGRSRITRITLKGMLISHISGGSQGFVDGSLALAQYRYIYDMVFVRNNLYIAVDYLNSRLRIVDLLNSRATTVCAGPSSRYFIDFPHSLLLLNSILYIGSRSAIRQLQVQHQELALAWLQVNSGTELLPTTLEESSTTVVSSTQEIHIGVLPIPFLSGLSLIFAVLTVTFIILFIKTKREVRSQGNNTCQVAMQSPNTIELTESANNDGVSLLYEVLDGSRIVGNQDYSTLNLQQPADPDLHISGISECHDYVNSPQLADNRQ